MNRPSRSVVQLDDVVVFLGGRKVLGPLSISISAGEFWVVLGPNGSGKSTLLSVMTADRYPTSGATSILGARLGRTDVRELRKRIGIVGHRQAERFSWRVTCAEVVLTGRDNLLTPWWGRFDEDDRRMARELLTQVDCGALVNQAFEACSQGERQRVLVARSMFGRHDLLVLDEPAVGMDMLGRELFRQLLDALGEAERALTIVLVVQTLDEIPATTSHAALLKSGEVVAAGAIDEVLREDNLTECFGTRLNIEDRRWWGSRRS